MPGRPRFSQLGRPIGGIVQDLDLQPIPRIIQRGRGVNQPLDDVLFIEDRQLHRDARPLPVFHFRRKGRVAAMAQVKYRE